MGRRSPQASHEAQHETLMKHYHLRHQQKIAQGQFRKRESTFCLSVGRRGSQASHQAQHETLHSSRKLDFFNQVNPFFLPHTLSIMCHIIATQNKKRMLREENIGRKSPRSTHY